MKNKKSKITICKVFFAIIILISFSSDKIHAQYKPSSELGLALGTSYYNGDISSAPFQNISASGGITYRRNIDRRFTLKSSAIYASIYADDENSNDPVLINRNLHFKSDITELSGQIEFNFLPYETGNSLYPWSPYVFVGFSLFNFNPKAEASDGEWYELQPLSTEGQGTTSRPNLKKYSLTQISMPFGGGFKFAVNKNFNIILEHGIRKTFTDYLDDVSTTYPGQPYPTEFNNLQIELSDRSLDGLPKQAGEARGNSKTDDWYSFSSITLSFQINQKSKGCDY